jgi:hypothetical protein
MHLATASDRYPRSSCIKEGRAGERERHEQGRGPEPSMIAHENGPEARRTPACPGNHYRYRSTANARAAPTAMPRASRAISPATRWRFTYSLLSR